MRMDYKQNLFSGREYFKINGNIKLIDGDCIPLESKKDYPKRKKIIMPNNRILMGINYPKRKKITLCFAFALWTSINSSLQGFT